MSTEWSSVGRQVRRKRSTTFQRTYARRSRRGKASPRSGRSHDADGSAFLGDVKTIGGEIGGSIDPAARPENLHTFDASGVAESEMDPSVVLREIAAAASDFRDLAPAARRYS